MDKEANNNNDHHKKKKKKQAAVAHDQEFEPYCRWKRKEDRDVLQIHLPDFKEDQFDLQINNQWNVKISGERPLDASNNKKKKFYKELTVLNSKYREEEDEESKEVYAKFANDWLQITLPKQMKKNTMSKNTEQELEAGSTNYDIKGMGEKFKYTSRPRRISIPNLMYAMLNTKSRSSRSYSEQNRRLSKLVVALAVILIAYVVRKYYNNT